MDRLLQFAFVALISFNTLASSIDNSVGGSITDCRDNLLNRFKEEVTVCNTLHSRVAARLDGYLQCIVELKNESFVRVSMRIDNKCKSYETLITTNSLDNAIWINQTVKDYYLFFRSTNKTELEYQKENAKNLANYLQYYPLAEEHNKTEHYGDLDYQLPTRKDLLRFGNYTIGFNIDFK